MPLMRFFVNSHGKYNQLGPNESESRRKSIKSERKKKKTLKTNRGSFAQFFPRLAPATCINSNLIGSLPCLGLF